MTSYEPAEAKRSQFPFPSYENGDLFLSWGSVAVKAYAEYQPALAVQYVKNVLNQYSKDGLAFQRYGRLKQDGLGDDILSGNSLSIVGLYQAVYGINPLYNRFYLNPHITPELAGTALNYHFRGERLTINLDNNSYAVSNKMFKVIAAKDFGFSTSKNTLSFFDGNSPASSLQAVSSHPLTIDIRNWSPDKIDWIQITPAPAPASKPAPAVTSAPIIYTLHQLKPNVVYLLSIDDKPARKIRTNAKGDLVIAQKTSAASESLSIRNEH